jgi:hypothetical protein
MNVLRVIIGFVVASIIATIGMSTVSTFTVQSNLAAMGFPVPFGDKISMYLDDLAGLAPAAGMINALGLLIAFGIAALIIRFVWNKAVLGFALAGFVALLAEMQMMSIAFDGITPIAGARTMSGLLALGLVGALAGLVFAKIKPGRA